MIPNITADTLDSAFTGVADGFSSIMPVITAIAAFIGVIVAVVGVFKLLNPNSYDNSSGWFYIVGGLILGGSGFIIPFLSGSISSLAGSNSRCNT